MARYSHTNILALQVHSLPQTAYRVLKSVVSVLLGMPVGGGQDSILVPPFHVPKATTVPVELQPQINFHAHLVLLLSIVTSLLKENAQGVLLTITAKEEKVLPLACVLLGLFVQKEHGFLMNFLATKEHTILTSGQIPQTAV